jgi:FlaA1/EpsC-like NDP-sugar epimerase
MIPTVEGPPSSTVSATSPDKSAAVPALGTIPTLVSIARKLTGNRPHLIVVVATLLIFAAAFVAAYLLRFEFNLVSIDVPFVLGALPWVLLVKLIVFYICGTYRILWAYVGIRDLLRLSRATVFASGGIVGTNFLLWRDGMAPRSVIVLDGILTFLAVGGLYVLLRYLREAGGLPSEGSTEPVVIIGAGDAGEALLREIHRNSLMGSKVVGFLDDAQHKQGHSLRGVPVLGRIQDIREIGYKYGVKKAFVAIPSASGLMMRRVVTHLLKAGMAIKVLPPLGKMANSSGFVPHLREVSMDDLLRRDPIKLDDKAISAFIQGKIVLVTGAAGSIGSELCRQILDYHPARLVALDCAETPLNDLILEIGRQVSKDLVIPELADVTNTHRITGIFQRYRPEIVFHAAALKHVPLMETHPLEAARVNIGGTRWVAEAAKQVGVKSFVLISTDKAVKPSSVMGATKRVAEMVVNHLNKDSSTNYVCVRFGNVLGSNGSVLRIFKSQLEKGGPLTVTHGEMRRYFMTIPEAVQLVLQAAVLGKSGETFVLDMGEPIRILDLAEDLIRLSGLIPGIDVKIEITGIRPGEKLFEEISLESESLVRTEHRQVFCLQTPSDCNSHPDFESNLNHVTVGFEDPRELLSVLHHLVTDYKQTDEEVS